MSTTKEDAVTVTDEPDIDAQLAELEDAVTDATDIEPEAEKSPKVPAVVEQGLDLPPAPGQSEFLVMAQMAKMLAESEIAPKAVRGKPHVAFHIGLIGRDLGISLSAALELVDVIDDKPSLSPELLSGQIRRMGLGRILPGERSRTRAVAIAIDSHGVKLGESEFTWEDAIEAGYIRDDCVDGVHSEACKTLSKSGDWNKRKNACKQNYRQHPKRMMWWRACASCASDYYPEASMGLYDADALGAMTNEDGELLELESVEVPVGYESQSDRKRQRQAEVEKITADESTELRDRASALPTEAKNELRDWAKGRESHLRFSDFTPGQAKTTAAFIAGLEKRAVGGEWGEWTNAVTGETNVGSADAPDNADTPDEVKDAVILCDTCQEEVCICDAQNDPNAPDVMDSKTLGMLLKLPDEGLTQISRDELEAACRAASVEIDPDCDEVDLVALLRQATDPM